MYSLNLEKDQKRPLIIEPRHLKEEECFYLSYSSKNIKKKYCLCFDFLSKHVQGTVFSICLNLYRSPIDFDNL